ncbi:DUF4113 domain-containing protein [Providencia sp. JUb39]|nr:DUF4113 domain-containing protein [Providencia sp. JUb39]
MRALRKGQAEQFYYGHPLGALWKMKQQFLSPGWTTQFSDIPVVKC